LMGWAPLCGCSVSRRARTISSSCERQPRGRLERVPYRTLNC
jgi:hypothetical protein